MFIRKASGVLAVAFMTALAIAAVAQQPEGFANPRIVLQQPDKTVTYASAADVSALVARAKKERKDNVPLVAGRIMRLAPYDVDLEYRPAGKGIIDPVGQHERLAEFMYVLQGSGTLITGGKVAPGPDNHMRIDGGETQNISKGDFVFIPENTPHWVSHIDKTLVFILLHVQRPAPKQF